MDRPNLSQFKTITDSLSIINHHSKSEIFLHDALNITALGDDLVAYRKWWSDKENRTSKRHFIFSVILALAAAANIVWSLMTEDNIVNPLLSLLIILTAGWNIWAITTSSQRRINRLKAEGYPYLSHEEFNIWIELMEAYVGVQDDDKDEAWNQAIVKLNTIHH